MKKTISIFIIVTLLIACSPMDTRQTDQQEIPDTVQQEKPDSDRALEINGKTLDSYTLWSCSDLGYKKPPVLWFIKTDVTFEDIIKEVAKSEKDVEKKLNDKELSQKLQELEKVYMGFILFDEEGNEKETAFYTRKGISHLWFWEDGNYSFVIEPDGSGVYYDLKSNNRDFFNCKKSKERLKG